ncbi:MAG: hypothetical protein HQL69_09185 [Magnetococcales bacterium]|nr:hypothetical protein [Magnetococcales bacterium]
MTQKSAVIVPRISGVGFYLPGEPLPITDLDLSQQELQRLPNLAQEFFHRSTQSSTALMVNAGSKAMEDAGVQPQDIGMVISAPSLITGHGLEIPAVTVRNQLKLQNAECLNLGQGCLGLFRAIQLAAQRLVMEPDSGDILIVIGCSASGLTRNNTHGSFFWGDGAAGILMSAKPGSGLHFQSYSECTSEADWHAMSIGFGDGKSLDSCDLDQDFHIQVAFESEQSQSEYVRGEKFRFNKVIKDLLQQKELSVGDLAGLAVPSLGQNRLQSLLGIRNPLQDKLIVDYRYGHMGAVDALLFLSKHLEQFKAADGEYFIALTPAYTAQWGGVLLRYIKN